MKRLLLLFVATVLMSGSTGLVFGQSWDNSGNNLLNGTYNFREILWVTDASANNTLLKVTSRYGTISFNGSGNYVVSGNEWNSDTNSITGYTPSNTYAISAGGYGFLNRAVDLQRVYGLVSNGIFVGSSTEGPVSNLFIAALKSSTDVTTATFNQNYTATYTNLTNQAAPTLDQIRDATFQLGPDGNGSLGTLSATGYIGSSTVATNLSVPGVSYSFTSGIGTLNLGAADPSLLISGSKLLYVANGGKFVFGGAPNGADMFVGVLTPIPANVPPAVFSNLYFQSGIDVDRSPLPSAKPYLNSYYGSFNVASSVTSILGHQRVQTPPDAAYDYTYSDTYTLSADGTFNDFLGIRRFLSLDGSIQVGYGVGNYLGISVAVKAPTLSSSGSSPYVNPNGVVNAASYAPFTAGLSPGELLTIFGSNLAPTGTAIDPTFPNSLNGVSVTINDLPAPIYIADPAGLAVLVPYGIASASVARIVVNNNGNSSVPVTAFTSTTSPGVFSGSQNGLGYPAARHTTRADQGIVTPADPALPGEYLAVFLTGLGPVNPAIAAGTLGPVNPLSFTTSTFSPTIAKKASESNFAGIAPVQRGLYQLNVKVPTDATAGDLFLEIKGPDAVNSQIKVPVRAATGSAIPAARSATDTPEFGKRPGPPHNSDSTRRGFDSGTNSDDSASGGQ